MRQLIACVAAVLLFLISLVGGTANAADREPNTAAVCQHQQYYANIEGKSASVYIDADPCAMQGRGYVYVDLIASEQRWGCELVGSAVGEMLGVAPGAVTEVPRTYFSFEIFGRHGDAGETGYFVWHYGDEPGWPQCFKIEDN